MSDQDDCSTKIISAKTALDTTDIYETRALTSLIGPRWVDEFEVGRPTEQATEPLTRPIHHARIATLGSFYRSPLLVAAMQQPSL